MWTVARLRSLYLHMQCGAAEEGCGLAYARVASVYVCCTADVHAETEMGTCAVSSIWVVQMRERFVVLNWILSERVTAVAAPLYQNIPVGNLTGYTVNIRVTSLAHADFP